MVSGSVALDVGGVAAAQTDKSRHSKIVVQLNDERPVSQRGSRLVHYKQHDEAPPELSSNSSFWKVHDMHRVGFGCGRIGDRRPAPSAVWHSK